MTTIRRDTLLKLAKAGKLVAVGSYHYDDMYGSNSFKGEKPVRVIDNINQFCDKYFNVREYDFKSRCGHARKGTNGNIHLHVHSNCSYDFRVKE